LSIQRYNKKQWMSELVYNIYNDSNNTNTKSITDHYHLNSSWHLLSELKWNYGYSMILNKRLHFVPEYSRTRLSNRVYKDATISNGYGQNVYKCCGNMFNWSDLKAFCEHKINQNMSTWKLKQTMNTSRVFKWCYRFLIVNIS